MKRILAVALLIPLMGADDCDRPRARVLDTLGPGTVCSYQQRDVYFCIRDGVRFECVSNSGEVACGIVTTPAFGAEAP